MKILVIAEHQHESLRPATAHTIAAAQVLAEKMKGAEIHVLVAGHQADGAAAAAAEMPGVSLVHLVEGEELKDQLAEPMTAQILSLAAEMNAFLFPATTFGKNIAPRVAARLDVAQVSDVIEIVAADTFKRPIYAGHVIATVQSVNAVNVLTVRATAFEPRPDRQPPAPIRRLTAVTAGRSAVFLSRSLAVLDRPELTAAQVVVSGGRALGSRENFALIEALADRLGGAVGASRAAVDAGYAPNDWQVGQTGKIVAPQLYIAVGISGAIQHLAGMKGARVIVAINQDPDAAIFQVADYGLVGDLFQILPELTAALSE